MYVVQTETRSFYVPLERLRFEPDPWAFAVLTSCSCAACRAKRNLAEKLGTPAGQLVFIPAVNGVNPWPAAGGTNHVAPAPLVTAFDTRRDGTPRLPLEPQPQPRGTQMRRCVHLAMEALQMALVFCLFCLCWIVVTCRRFVLGQPFLRVVREEETKE